MGQQTILVTGGSGFIGSNFIKYIINKYPQYSIINLDVLTYAANPQFLEHFKDHPQYKFIQGNICNKQLIDKIFAEYNIHDVIHFAAESHVDNSIQTPEVFIQSNILGTFVLLDKVKNVWLDENYKVKAGFETSRFHHISTDEVFGSLGQEGLFSEFTPYMPNSPYSASKAASDHLVRAYNKTYGLNTTLTNCSNNFGPHQHDEKLIPTIIRNAINNNSIPVYGKGENIRDWLFVEDHCKAIDLVFHRSESGQTYNIGGNNELRNIDLVYSICRKLDELVPRKNHTKYEDLITFVPDRPGHDLRYAIDASKIENVLGFKEISKFDDAIEKTIQWYLAKYI
ncbi:MAG: dTDP-glucose 4,6-dehydratase [Halobacteriovoraceae bacterium]|nr:dTDP-glucose 4,6-dehydratase [Halobacteriovoraceae bacterium]